MPPIIAYLKGKRIAILGFGKEGKSTYAYIRKYLPSQPLTIADLHPIADELSNVELIIGEDYQKLDDFDVVIKSPGIVLEQPLKKECLESQTNLFLRYYGEQTIGITGTKGKSTTSSLLYHILKENNVKCVLLGNIGKPAFDALDQIDEETRIVYELSCHQLEYVRYAPHIGVLLNIHEEHLDHYGTYEKYIQAKENIWRMQKAEDLLVCEKTLIQADMCAKVISASMEDAQADIYAQKDQLRLLEETLVLNPEQTPLLGHHNRYDIGVDLYIAHMLGISYEASLQALASFEPLPHRLQYVGYYHHLHWYDDSISTICETTIQALQSLDHIDTLLLGGMDRGIDYTPLSDYLNAHPLAHVILMYDSGEVLAKQLSIPFIKVKDLQEAVEVAKRVAQPQGSVLLSPAAASYGFFRNFEDRGDHFQAYLKQ